MPEEHIQCFKSIVQSHQHTSVASVGAKPASVEVVALDRAQDELVQMLLQLVLHSNPADWVVLAGCIRGTSPNHYSTNGSGTVHLQQLVKHATTAPQFKQLRHLRGWVASRDKSAEVVSEQI